MIPTHRWALPLGTHFDDLAGALPPSHLPTFEARPPERRVFRAIAPTPAGVPSAGKVASEQVGRGSGVGFTAWG